MLIWFSFNHRRNWHILHSERLLSRRGLSLWILKIGDFRKGRQKAELQDRGHLQSTWLAETLCYSPEEQRRLPAAK